MAKQSALLVAALFAAIPALAQSPAPLPVPDVAPPAPIRAFAMGYALEALSAAVVPVVEVALEAPPATPGGRPAARPQVAAVPKPATSKPSPKAATPAPKPAAPAPKPAAPMPPVPPPAAAGELVRGPIDVLGLQRTRRVQVSHSALEPGTAERIFDGNRHTFAPARPGPGAAFCQVVLDRPRLLDEVNVAFTPGAPHNWSLLAADTEADMAERKGSFRQLFQPRIPQFEGRDQVTLPSPRPYRVYRVEYRRLSGEGGPELAEWSLWTPQALARMEVDTFVPNVAVGQKIQLRADAFFEAGASQNMTPEVRWEVVPPTAGAVDELGRFEGKLPGAARVFALHNNRRSEPLTVEIFPQGQPDWTVTHIERQPRLHLEETGTALKPGQTVYWFAHVRNYGTGNAEPVTVEWRMDGKTIRSGSLPKIERFAQTEIILGLPWDEAPHTLELVVDPENQVPETSKANNRLAVRTDALSVGFWVEDSTLRYFHRRQKELGIGSNSFEDWAQRQVQFWNRWMAGSAWFFQDRQLSTRRFRLDRIIVVGDGMLPMAGGSPELDPDRRDDTVHITVGVPAFDPAYQKLYSRTTEKSMENPFYYQASLLGMLGRVRYAAPPKSAAEAAPPPAPAPQPAEAKPEPAPR